MPSLNTGNAILSNAIAVNSSYNVGIGGAASGSFKLQVTGTTNLTGALTGTSATFSGDLAVDTNTLYVDSTNNRVGIGTVGSSGYLLDVFGTATFGASTTIGDKVHIGSGAVPSGAAGIGLWATGSNLFSIVGFGDMTIDSRGSFLLINPNGGNVGISTSSPNSALQVGSFSGNNAISIGGATNGVSSLYFGDGTGAALYRGFIEYQHNGDYMRIGTSATEAINISSAGVVGIGVTPNTWDGTNVRALQVYNTSLSGSLTWGASLGWNNYYNGGWKYIFTGTAGKYDIGGDEHIWSNAPSGTAGNAISFVERMKINSAGNIEIKTTRTSGSNVNTITIADNVTGVQTSGFGVRILATSNNGGAKCAIGFEADGGTNNDTAIAFYTQTNAASLDRRMTINRNGNVLINTTADYGFKFVGSPSGDSFLGNTMQISAGDFGGTERQGAFGVSEWANQTSAVINLATVFPRITFSSRALSVLVQIGTANNSTSHCAALVLFSRTSNGGWSSSIISNINNGGTTLNSVSGSGTSITLNFNNATFGSAMITILNRA